MTEPAAMTEPGAPRRRPRALPTVLAAIACFGVAFEFLAFQLYTGQDPALGSGAATQQEAPVKKKIVITKVVGSSGTSATAGTSGSTSYTAAAPAPVATSSS